MKGIVYKISFEECDDLYIGSTMKSLGERKQSHFYSYNRWKEGVAKMCACYELFDKYGFDKAIFNIECVVELKGETNTQQRSYLRKFEANVIENYGELCVNKVIPTSFNCENGRLNYMKQYNNCEYIKEQKKKWKEKNKEILKEKDKLYSSTRVKCEVCDLEMNRGSLSRHKKRKH